jgi:hypothetical protein
VFNKSISLLSRRFVPADRRANTSVREPANSPFRSALVWRRTPFGPDGSWATPYRTLSPQCRPDKQRHDKPKLARIGERGACAAASSCDTSNAVCLAPALDDWPVFAIVFQLGRVHIAPTEPAGIHDKTERHFAFLPLPGSATKPTEIRIDHPDMLSSYTSFSSP